jgi:PPOX class probable F420-dependent enzyme
MAGHITVDRVSSLDEIAKSQYVLVTTFRKDGRAVPTPVWAAPFEGGIGFWTVTDSGKVKRIRRSSRVTVATCDIRGNKAGPAVEAKASLLDSDGSERVRQVLRRKYGIMGRITMFFSKVRRGKDGTVGIKIVLG